MTKMKTLPVPKLSDTKDELIQWVKPFLSPNEFKAASKEIEHFFTHSTEGEKLQNKLLTWNDETEINWLSPLWNESYLSYPDKLHLGLSYHMVLKNKHFIQKNQTELIADLLQRATAYYHFLIDSSQLVGQQAKLFKATRIPNEPNDTYFIGEPSKKNNYVIFSYHNIHYKIFVSDQVGDLIQTEHLIQQIKEIKQTKNQADFSINYLSSTNRAQAFKLYQEIKIDNQAALDNINNALFFFHLDRTSQTSLETLKSSFLNAEDKYYDKTLQFGISKNNHISLSVEHTYVDATTLLPLIDYLYETEIDTDSISKQTPNYQTLSYTLSKDIIQSLTQIKEVNKSDLKLFQVNELKLKEVNASKIKAAAFSPDAFFQMALQIAQYKTFNKIKSTYEPVAMTDYLGGRTECIRPVTNESVELTRRYVKEASDDLILEQMKQAAAEHKRRIIKCLNGQGVERHLFALEAMYDRYSDELELKVKPDVFSNNGVKQLTKDFISTTNVTHKWIDGFIFGPVIEGGFGLYYSLLDDEITVNISSEKSNSSDKLIKELENALVNLLKIANKSSS